MKNYENVKTIGLKVAFEGEGCVNFDSNDQKFILNQKGLAHLSNDNNVLAKKNFYVDKNGNEYFKHKVSSECIRHEIFKKAMPFHNPSIVGIPAVLYSTIAMPEYILRGYAFTRNGSMGLKKKSQITITDAEEVTEAGNTAVNMEIHTRSGNKKENTENSESKDNCLYNMESVGRKAYEANGFINLTELQFIPDDPKFDRVSLALEEGSVEEKCFMDSLKRNMVNLTPSLKYYKKNGCFGSDAMAERGVLLNKESVDMIVKETLKNILSINILRRGAYFKTTGLDVTVIMADGTTDDIKITAENVNDFTFNFAEEYVEANEAEAIKAHDDMMAYIDAQDNAKKAKKDAAKAKKEKKNNEETIAE